MNILAIGGLELEFRKLSKGAEFLLGSICKAREAGKDPARILWEARERNKENSGVQDLMSSPNLRNVFRELESAGYITTQWTGDSLTSVLVDVSIETYRERLKENKRKHSIIAKIFGFFRR